MRRLILLVVFCFCLAAAALALVPGIAMPERLTVKGNGLHSLAFVVYQTPVSAEVEKSLRYYLEGGPIGNSATFDDHSKLFFWRPEQQDVGEHTFSLTVQDSLGNQTEESVVIEVKAAPSIEALPHGWQDLKETERYLIGRDYLLSSHLIEFVIAALPAYQIDITVKDSFDQVCYLTYLPQEGTDIVNKGARTATIMLGGQYDSDSYKTVRRDLYEDLFNTIDLVFKRVDAIKITGDFSLKSFTVTDNLGLIAAAGSDDIYLPRLNLAFDDRFYEDSLYSAKEPILISDTPVIKIDFNTTSGLIWRRAKLFINETEYNAAWGDFSTIVVKPYKKASSFDIEHAMYVLRIPTVKKLPFGEHHISFQVENAYGLMVSREAYARVVTLPTQVEGKPMVFPSPFNPSLHNEVKIQYRLSLQSNIELVIFGGDGSTVMKKRFAMGDEGGKKGLNTVTWNGKSDSGMSVSNGIYIGVIIDKDENRILDKFRLTVFR